MKRSDAFREILDFRLPASGSKGRLEVPRDGAVVIVSEALFFPPSDYRESQMYRVCPLFSFSRHGHESVHRRMACGEA